MTGLPDPTYDREEIDADDLWRLAFRMSERVNDSAPLGWSAFIPGAVELFDLVRQGWDEDSVLDRWEANYHTVRAERQARSN